MSDVNHILTSLLLSHAIRRYFWRIVFIEVSYILERIFVFLEERTSNLTILRSISGAPPETRTLGPLIKRASRRFVSIYRSFELSLFFNKTTCFLPSNFCTLCHILHRKVPFARFETVQNPCRNRALALRQIKSLYPPPT